MGQITRKPRVTVGGVCGGGVGAMFMDSGELRSGHSGRVDVYLHEVPVRERGEVA